MALPAASDDERQFTVCAVVPTHSRSMGSLSVVYTNDLIWVENSIHAMERLLAAEK
jgi:hypothetical protein